MKTAWGLLKGLLVMAMFAGVPLKMPDGPVMAWLLASHTRAFVTTWIHHDELARKGST